MFLREHNRLARLLSKQNPSWTDEQIYSRSRILNIAQYQNIVFYEYLPALVGEDFFVDSPEAAYPGYNDSVNPTIREEFSVLCFLIFSSSLIGKKKIKGFWKQISTR